MRLVQIDYSPLRRGLEEKQRAAGTQFDTRRDQQGNAAARLGAQRLGISARRLGLQERSLGIAEQRLGIQQGRLNLERQNLSLGARRLDIGDAKLVLDQKGLGLEREGIGLAREGIALNREGLAIQRANLELDRLGLGLETSRLEIEKNYSSEKSAEAMERIGLGREGLGLDYKRLEVQRASIDTSEKLRRAQNDLRKQQQEAQRWTQGIGGFFQFLAGGLLTGLAGPAGALMGVPMMAQGAVNIAGAATDADVTLAQNVISLGAQVYSSVMQFREAEANQSATLKFNEAYSSMIATGHNPYQFNAQTGDYNFVATPEFKAAIEEINEIGQKATGNDQLGTQMLERSISGNLPQAAQRFAQDMVKERDTLAQQYLETAIETGDFQYYADGIVNMGAPSSEASQRLVSGYNQFAYQAMKQEATQKAVQEGMGAAEAYINMGAETGTLRAREAEYRNAGATPAQAAALALAERNGDIEKLSQSLAEVRGLAPDEAGQFKGEAERIIKQNEASSSAGALTLEQRKDLRTSVAQGVQQEADKRAQQAVEAYRAARGKGENIFSAVTRAMGAAAGSKNTEIQDAVGKAIIIEQISDLEDTFDRNMSKADTLDELRALARDYKPGEDGEAGEGAGAFALNYVGQPGRLRKHYEEIQRDIASWENAIDKEAAARGAAQDQQVKDQLEAAAGLIKARFEMWKAGDLDAKDGRTLLADLWGEMGAALPLADRNAMIDALVTGTDGMTATGEAYKEMKSRLQFVGEDRLGEISEALYEARLRGAQPDELKGLIDGFVTTETASWLKLMSEGTTLTGGNLAAYVDAANAGELDAYFYERTGRTPTGARGVAKTIGGEDMDKAMMGVEIELKRMLKAQGIDASVDMARDKEGDVDGYYIATGTDDGARYRLGTEKVMGTKRVILEEEQKNGTWKKTKKSTTNWTDMWVGPGGTQGK